MNSSMSGWSTSRTTIFAARRVLPPDLIVPADASAPRMKETGPEAYPPFESCSFDERRRERFTPDPEPPRTMTPSLRLQSRMASIEPSIERMEPAAEVLRGADVRRRRRPELRELDPALLERRPRAARDQRVADLPLDLVERVPPGDREEPADAEARGLVDNCVDHLLDRLTHAR